MSELKAVQQAIHPTDTLLVVDAMTGQEAAGLVKAFNDTAPLSGASNERAQACQTGLLASNWCHVGRGQ